MRRIVIYSTALLLFSCHVFAQNTSRAVDYASSAVTFKIKNAGIGVDGSFKDYTAVVVFDPKHLEGSYIEGKIKTNSIHTGINARDNHLRKDDFFDVTKYPEINFKSTSIKQQGSAYTIVGKLVIKDVAKEITLPLTVSRNGGMEVYETSLALNRLDYHVGESSWTMSDEVLINIKIITK